MQNSTYTLGLYHAHYEHDACGVGFVANIKGPASNTTVRNAQQMLERMDHRTSCTADTKRGDGSGVRTAIPHAMFQRPFPEACESWLR